MNLTWNREEAMARARRPGYRGGWIIDHWDIYIITDHPVGKHPRRFATHYKKVCLYHRVEKKVREYLEPMFEMMANSGIKQ